jgi:hypothetical protein
MPAGLPAQALWPYGRDAWSSEFLSTPGIERLYSGVEKKQAFHSGNFSFQSLYGRALMGIVILVVKRQITDLALHK